MRVEGRERVVVHCRRCCICFLLHTLVITLWFVHLFLSCGKQELFDSTAQIQPLDNGRVTEEKVSSLNYGGGLLFKMIVRKPNHGCTWLHSRCDVSIGVLHLCRCVLLLLAVRTVSSLAWFSFCFRSWAAAGVFTFFRKRCDSRLRPSRRFSCRFIF